MPADNYAVNWNGFLAVPATGNWQFRITHDDNVTVDVNGVVTNSPSDVWCGTFDTTAVALTAGTPVPIKIRYREGGGLPTSKCRRSAMASPTPSTRRGSRRSRWRCPSVGR